MLKHNTRYNPYSKKLPEFIISFKNEYKGANIKNFYTIYDEYCRKFFNKINGKTGQFIEIIVSFNSEYCRGWERDLEKQMQIKAYFNKINNYLAESVGITFISSAEHWDEMTPHVHFLFIPICGDKTGIFRISPSELIEKIEKITNNCIH